MLNKNKVILYCDRIIMVCLCFSFFCLPFAKAGVETFIWVAIFIWLLKRTLGYRTGAFWGMLPETKLNKALGIFILANLISVIFSTHFGLSLRGLVGKELKFLIIYFMLVEVVNSKERLKAVLTTIIVSVVLMIADAAVQYFSAKDFLRGNLYTRLTASFSSSNGFAAWLIVIIPLFLGLLVSGKAVGKRLKSLLLVLSILLSACLLMTYTRGAWLGCAIGLSLIGYYAIKGSSLKTKRILLLSSISLLFLFLILPRPIRNIMKDVGSMNFRLSQTLNQRLGSVMKISEGSSLIRINLWQESLMIMKDYPLTGCGLNTYSKVAPHYKRFEGGGIYPHNSFLQMGAEIGLLGLFAFLWLLFVFFKEGFRFFRKTGNFIVLGLLSGISAFLVHAFFDTHLYSLQLVILFWFMLGLTVSIMNLEDNALPHPHNS